jgi:hypothetical protein
MAVLRTDIEKALDDLKSNEGGLEFQGLAVILIKRRWPDLIASERKSDLGADAIAKPAFAAEGEGKVLACSTTATIEKIRNDAKRIKDNFAGISKLIFATPDTVSNKRAEEWAAEIRKEFGYDLAIMEREDFITSLMDPLNASLLQPHLGLAVPVEPDIQDRLARARAAASEIAASWTRHMAAQYQNRKMMCHPLSSPQHRLCLRPLPQGHGSLRPIRLFPELRMSRSRAQAITFSAGCPIARPRAKNSMNGSTREKNCLYAEHR